MSKAHIMSSIKAAYREKSFPIIQFLEEEKNMDKALNKEIVRHLIKITLYLGRHCLPFRGHKEGWNEKLMGNFKDLAVLLAKYSPVLSSYFTEVQLKEGKSIIFISAKSKSIYSMYFNGYQRYHTKRTTRSKIF